MLSYVFRNGRNKREDILRVCNEEFVLQTIRDNENGICLINALLTILISDDYTHVLLKNEDVNVKRLEAIF